MHVWWISAPEERLWESMTEIYTKDDQYMLNYGMERMNVTWKLGVGGRHLEWVSPHNIKGSCNTSEQMQVEFIGRGDHNLKVILVRPKLACRGRLCNLDMSYRGHYVWHRGQTRHQQDNMQAIARRESVWFLQDGWRLSRSATGVRWLEEISNHDAFELKTSLETTV